MSVGGFGTGTSENATATGTGGRGFLGAGSKIEMMTGVGIVVWAAYLGVWVFVNA